MKLKDKLIIRKMSTARLFYDRQKLIANRNHTSSNRWSTWRANNALVAHRRSGAVLFLLLTLGLMPLLGNAVTPSLYKKNSSSRGFVAVLALGSASTLQLFYRLFRLADIRRAFTKQSQYLYITNPLAEAPFDDSNSENTLRDDRGLRRESSTDPKVTLV